MNEFVAAAAICGGPNPPAVCLCVGRVGPPAFSTPLGTGRQGTEGARKRFLLTSRSRQEVVGDAAGRRSVRLRSHTQRAAEAVELAEPASQSASLQPVFNRHSTRSRVRACVSVERSYHGWKSAIIDEIQCLWFVEEI